MELRVDNAIAQVSFRPPSPNNDLNFHYQVREYHRQYKEEGLNTRDVMIVAHGHFSRVFISRWINFPLCLGNFGFGTMHTILIQF
jgi:broad specificity phosphatase PhoE